MSSIFDRVLDLAIGTLGGTKLTKTETIEVNSDITQIILHCHNGSISWSPLLEGSKPHLVVEKQAWGSDITLLEEYLNQSFVNKQSNANSLLCKAITPSRPRGVRSAVASFTLYASPEQIKDFQAQTTNGQVAVNTEFLGNLDLKTQNGRIELYRGSGKLRLSTSNGRIELGSIELTDSSTISTSNGQINGTVSFTQEGNYDFSTSNGRINLRIPQHTEGSFELRTSNGHIDFALGKEKIDGEKSISIIRQTGPKISARSMSK